jgi:hypothetical protein
MSDRPAGAASGVEAEGEADGVADGEAEVEAEGDGPRASDFASSYPALHEEHTRTAAITIASATTTGDLIGFFTGRGLEASPPWT